MTPNGWPSSTRSIRPGTTATAAEAVADGRRVEPDRLAERDDRQGVVDVEPARRAAGRTVAAPDGAS